jgi:two-component system chemotaxis response regulator CheY
MTHNILIVDDSATTRAVIRRIVELSGVTSAGNVREAANGREALELLGEQPADLVLADLHMPEMSGVEMSRRMLADERLRHVPVVVVTAEPNLAKLEALKAQGIRGYLRKPFTPEAVRKLVTETLGAAHAA